MDFSDSDNSGDEFGLLKKALDVELPDNFDPNSIPQTGEQYLQHVIYERTKKCKKCVTAKADFSKFHKNQTVHLANDTTIQKAPPKFCPTDKWQHEAIEDYMQLRNYLVNSSDNNDPILASLNIDSFLKKLVTSSPKHSDIIKYSQASKIKMLHFINDYLENFDHSLGISDNVGSWIYAILALLEKPLSPDCCFELRKFAKKCASIRASLKDDSPETIAVPLNLYICIIARYFNQLDLAD